VVKLRLQRYGSKKRPFYRVVAADVNSPRDGRFIEQLGTYDPIRYEDTIQLNTERVQYWIQSGAQPTDTVRGLLLKTGILNKGA